MSLPNLLYKWCGHTIQHQVSGPINATRSILLVHSLFVNSNHWRKTLVSLGSDDDDGGKDVRVYMLDLLGSGWLSKPRRDNPSAVMVNGKNGRFVDCNKMSYWKLNGGAAAAAAVAVGCHLCLRMSPLDALWRTLISVEIGPLPSPAKSVQFLQVVRTACGFPLQCHIGKWWGRWLQEGCPDCKLHRYHVIAADWLSS